MSTLENTRIALLATDGVERVELTRPRDALTDAGATVDLIGLSEDDIRTFDHLDPAESLPADVAVAVASHADYAALVLPGGVANPDALRTDSDAVSFVREFLNAGKPVAAICHAPWTLIEADVVRGRRMTSWPSLKTDLRNAGAEWVDEEVVVDRGLLTSRNPDDLPAFCDALLEIVAEAA